MTDWLSDNPSVQICQESMMEKENDFADHNEFDKYAKEIGWVYDNGWDYEGESWESYAGPDGFRYVQMLRQKNGRIICIQIGKGPHKALWSGEVFTYSEFDKMIEEIKGFAG